MALAGTVGALGMLGHRRGGVMEPFVTGGQALLPGIPSGAAAGLGLLMHALWIAAWSLLFAAPMQRDRRAHAAIPAAVVALIAFAISLGLPAAFVGPLAALSTAERGLVHVVLAVALALGMRIAPRG